MWGDACIPLEDALQQGMPPWIPFSLESVGKKATFWFQFKNCKILYTSKTAEKNLLLEEREESYASIL